MKTYLFLALGLLAGGLPATTLSTVAHRVSGIIVAAGEPLEYATVSAFDLEGELIEGTVTDDAGQFALQLEPGEYRFLFEFIGFAEQELNLTVAGPLDLGTLTLGQASVNLDAITVTGERSEMTLSLDKKVFNLGQDLLARGGSANQVLEQLPSVTVSVDGVVALRGNAGVRILINGRPSALADNNALESIPAESIDRVEIITNPSARYEASGTAGIINIILKKEQTGGYGGTVSLSAGYPADHRLNLNLNIRRPKWSAFFNGGLRYSNYRGQTRLDRRSVAIPDLPVLDQNADQDRQDRAGNFFTGFDYQVADGLNLAVNYSLYHMVNDDEERTTYDYFGLDGEALVEQSQLQDYLEPGTYHQIDLNITKRFGEGGGQLNLYFNNDIWMEEESEAIQLDQNFPDQLALLDYRTSTDEGSRDHLLQLDYERPVGENGRFEAGIRGETRVISADYRAETRENGTFRQIPGLRNDYNYYERIGAAYVQFSQQWDKLGLQLGLRHEYTDIRTENSDEVELPDLAKDYHRLFPSASLNYRFSETNSTQLSYSRRLRRPQFWQLNPFAGLDDPNALFIGNPDLDPAFTDRIEWNYLAQGERWTFNPAIYASRTLDFFSQFVEQGGDNLFGLPTGTILRRPLNLEREDRFGLEVITSFRPGEDWSLSSELNVYGSEQQGTFRERDLSADFVGWSAGLRIRGTLPGDLNFQTRVNYEAPQVNAQSRSLSQWSGDLGLSKRWGERFTLSFNLRSPRYWNAEFFGPGFEQTIRQSWTIWRSSMTVAYRFEKGADSRERRSRGSIR